MSVAVIVYDADVAVAESSTVKTSPSESVSPTTANVPIKESSVCCAPRVNVSLPAAPFSVTLPVQPFTVKVLAPSPPVSVSASILVSVAAPNPDRSSEPVDRVKSASFEATNESLPVLPSRVAVPDQPLKSKLLSSGPPTTSSISKPDRLIVSVPPRVNEPSVTVKLVLLIASSMSLPFPPLRLPTPVQPLTMNVWSPLLSERSAISMLVSDTVPSPDRVRELSESVKFASFAAMIVSLPPLPSSVPVLVQLLIVKLLPFAPPVKFACSILRILIVPIPLRASEESLSTKSVSLVAMIESELAAPLIVPVPVQPLIVKLFGLAPPVRFAISTLASPIPHSPDRLSKLSTRTQSASFDAIPVSFPAEPSMVPVPVQPLPVIVFAPVPPVSWAISTLSRLMVPSLARSSDPSLSVNAVSLAAISVSLPAAPLMVPDPVQPLTLKLLYPDPPLRLDVSKPDKLNDPAPLRAKRLSVSVKSVSLEAIRVSLPDAAFSVPVPVQSVTVNVLSAAPPVSSATSMLKRSNVSTPVRSSEISASVKLVSFTAITVSLPAPPFSVPVPVQAVTSKLLAVSEPVSSACSMPVKFTVPTPVRTNESSASTKFVSPAATTESLPVAPAIVPVPLQPLDVNLFPADPPVRLGISMLARLRSPNPDRASELSANVKFKSFVVTTMSPPLRPFRVPVPVQPVTVKLFELDPPVRFAASKPMRLKVPRPVRIKELSVSVKSVSLTATRVSLPLSASRVPVPVQPVTVKLLISDPPVRLAVSKPTRVKVPAPLRASDPSVNVKSASLTAISMSLPPAASSIPVPVQPLTVKELPPGPALKLAISISTRFIVPRPVRASELLVSVKSTSFTASRVSLPPAPFNVPVPVQLLTVKLFALVPPVRLARSIPVKFNVPSPVRARALSSSVKSLSLPATTKSLPSPPLSVPVPDQPPTLKLLSDPPPVKLATSRLPPRTRLAPPETSNALSDNV